MTIKILLSLHWIYWWGNSACLFFPHHFLLTPSNALEAWQRYLIIASGGQHSTVNGGFCWECPKLSVMLMNVRLWEPKWDFVICILPKLKWCECLGFFFLYFFFPLNFFFFHLKNLTLPRTDTKYESGHWGHVVYELVVLPACSLFRGNMQILRVCWKLGIYIKWFLKHCSVNENEF